MIVDVLTFEIEKAKQLLTDDEKFLPKNVEKSIQFCVHSKIDFVLSRNEDSRSCEDACKKRFRLGDVGIPLHDELKTLVYKGFGKDGHGKIVVVHCRGNVYINLKNVTRLLSLESLPKMMKSKELLRCFEAKTGTVNPMLLEISSDHHVCHIFDIGLTFSMPNSLKTIMTNAGDRTWGIEFDPKLLISSMKNSCIGVISMPEKL